MTDHRAPTLRATWMGGDVAGTKRRAYLTYFAVVLAGVLMLWRVVPHVNPAVASVADAIVPATLAFFAVCLVVLWRWPDTLRIVEVLQYVAYFPILLGLLALLLSSATTEVGRHEAVAAFSVWLPMVVVWSFVVFGSKGGPYAAFGFLCAAGAVIASHLMGGASLGAAGVAFVVQSGVATAVSIVLLYALSYLLERQTANRLAAEVAAEYAVKDVLTGVFTRFALGVRFEQALSLARRTNRRLAVALLDLDDFKPVNDDLGHAAGDEVLRVIATRMTAAVRDADTVARIGGDEFVTLAFVDGAAHARRLAERLVSLTDDPIFVNGLEARVRASVGVSVFPDDAETVEGLLAAADAAMYAAKAAGKGQVALAAQAISDTLVPRSGPVGGRA
jgi:diguanylate cyclase (GGDEF)-like protein